MLNTNFSQDSNCFRHLGYSFEVEITNHKLVPFGAAFSSDAIRKELNGLISVACLIHQLDVEQASQDFSNREVCEFFSADNQNLTASATDVYFQI